jgi:hypothetical protein
VSRSFIGSGCGGSRWLASWHALGEETDLCLIMGVWLGRDVSSFLVMKVSCLWCFSNQRATKYQA